MLKAFSCLAAHAVETKQFLFKVKPREPFHIQIDLELCLWMFGTQCYHGGQKRRAFSLLEENSLPEPLGGPVWPPRAESLPHRRVLV